VRVLVLCLSLLILPARALAQMSMPVPPLGISDARDGSGTSWLPDESVMAGPMIHGSTWMVMYHWNVFGQLIRTGGPRGDTEFGSVNWFMAMAQRNARGGVLSLRGMVSAEPWTVGKCGYPNLLQTGESCNGALLHDRQHPHDLFMEIAADYRRELSKTAAFQLYGGLAGEPALGPVAFPHRASAMPNVVAPMSHHWLDSSHISFGVVTAGVYGKKWKAEGSLFNGREPDDNRFGIDLAPLDSYSGRLWFLPTARWAFQVSSGRLKEAEVNGEGHAEDVDRVTASATYHRLVSSKLWSNTFAWGRNSAHGSATSAFLAESALDVTANDQVFGRAELAEKSGEELVLEPHHDTFRLAKFQAGYTRWLPSPKTRVGVGARVGVSVVPDALRAFYGSRAPLDLALFVTLRPR
jgi:hypothetical protein